MPNVLRPVAYLDVQVLAGGVGGALPGRPPSARDPRARTAAGRWRTPCATRRSASSACRSAATSATRSTAMPTAPAPAALDTVGCRADARRGLLRRPAGGRRAELVDGVVRMLFSPELLSVAGMRGRGLSDHNPRFRSYHENVWPVDTAIARAACAARGSTSSLTARSAPAERRQHARRRLRVRAVDADGRVIDPRSAPRTRRACSARRGRPADRDGTRRAAWAGRRPRCSPSSAAGPPGREGGWAIAERRAGRRPLDGLASGRSPGPPLSPQPPSPQPLSPQPPGPSRDLPGLRT